MNIFCELDRYMISLYFVRQAAFLNFFQDFFIFLKKCGIFHRAADVFSWIPAQMMRQKKCAGAGRRVRTEVRNAFLPAARPAAGCLFP